MNEELIRTSEKGWVIRYASALVERRAFLVEDDAEVGIEALQQAPYRLGLNQKLSTRQWMAFLTAFGFGLIGAGIILAAILDPEPTSKLGLLVVIGGITAFTGCGQALRILVGLKSPNIEYAKGGHTIRITWD